MYLILKTKPTCLLFNDFFVSQTYLPIENAVLPELSPNLNSTLSNIIVTEVEVANLTVNWILPKLAGWMELAIKLLSFVIMVFTSLLRIS